MLDVAHDFVRSASSARVVSGAAFSASLDERSGEESLPGLFLHPSTDGPGVVHFEGVSVPALAEGERVLLLFAIGLRDGVPFEGRDRTNGVRFSVGVDGRELFSEAVAEAHWHRRAVDLGRYAGGQIDVTWKTDAIDGNTSHDWALFGDPVLVVTRPSERKEPPDGQGVLALARLRSEHASRSRVSLGGSALELRLPPGTTWLPLDLSTAEPSAPSSATLKKIRLEVLDGRTRIEDIELAIWSPDLHVEEVSLSTPLALTTETLAVHLRVANRGRGAWHRDAVDAESKNPLPPLIFESPDAGFQRDLAIESLAPGAETTLVVDGIEQYSPGDAEVRVGEHRRRWHIFRTRPREFDKDTSPRGIEVRQQASSGSRQASIASEGARLRFVVESRPDGPTADVYAITETWNGEGWLRTGTLNPLARLIVRNARGRPVEHAWRARREISTEDRLSFEGVFESAESGESWPATIAFTAVEGEPRIAIEYEVQFEGASDVLALYGPDLAVGDHSPHPRHDQALFPGLEYLERHEGSSSTRDLTPPLSDRRVPAAYKITRPLMAIESGGTCTSLHWRPLDSWSDRDDAPVGYAARFEVPAPASPARPSRLALFVPPVGEHVTENSFLAKTPWRARTGETLRLSASIAIEHREGGRPGELLLDSLRHTAEWLPPASPPPRSWPEQLRLSMDAYLGVLWQDSPAAVRHCADWPAGLLTGHALPMRLAADTGLLPKYNADIREKTQRLIARGVEARGPGSLWRGNGCHVLLGELPWHVGWLPESLADLRRQAQSLLAARVDGFWRWQPSSERHRSLGRPGHHVLGTAANPAFQVLRAARLSGDRDLKQRGLKALRQLDLYRVPRGAQMWECPLEQPDILAAAYAVRAHCEAYRLTDDEQYLHRARYWARTGLPFLYSWELPGYPTMRYNTTAVFGSTFHRHSWIGLPVVWCGLVYAYALQDLALFDESLDWNRIALGITRSAEWQQYTRGPHRGCYPDSWSLADNEPRPADINPEDILVNEFRLRGAPLWLRHRLVRIGDGQPASLNSNADIDQLAASEHASKLSLSLKTNWTTRVHTTLAPCPRPLSLTVDGVEIDEQAGSEQLAQAGAGWLWDEALRLLVVACESGDEPRELQVRWVAD